VPWFSLSAIVSVLAASWHQTALEFMTATLVVTYPCALGPSGPAVLIVASSLSPCTYDTSPWFSVPSRLPYHDYLLIVVYSTGCTATPGVILTGRALTMQHLSNLTTVAFDKPSWLK
jgi:cation transport ATPase